jgi:hypothetical protein
MNDWVASAPGLETGIQVVQRKTRARAIEEILKVNNVLHTIRQCKQPLDMEIYKDSIEPVVRVSRFVKTLNLIWTALSKNLSVVLDCDHAENKHVRHAA